MPTGSPARRRRSRAKHAPARRTHRPWCRCISRPRSARPSAVSTSCAVMRSALPAFRALPVNAYRTPSVRPISRMPLVVPLSCSEEVREITRSAFTPERSVISSSVRPSLKYSFSGIGAQVREGQHRNRRVAAGAVGAVGTSAPWVVLVARAAPPPPGHRSRIDRRPNAVRVGSPYRRRRQESRGASR